MQSHCTRTQFHASIPKSRFLNGPRVGLLAARPKCGQTASKGLFGLKSQYLVGHAAVVHQPRNLVFTPRAHPREEPPPLHDRQALVLVNYGDATGGEVLALAHKVQEAVRAKFGVEIAAEVNVL